MGREQTSVHGLLKTFLAGDTPQQITGVHVPQLAICSVTHLVDAAQQRHMQRAVVLHRVARDQVAAMLHRLPGRVVE
ncbi:hypothetical protein D3C76_911020 [compost metagenome]